MLKYKTKFYTTKYVLAQELGLDPDSEELLKILKSKSTTIFTSIETPDEYNPSIHSLDLENSKHKKLKFIAAITLTMAIVRLVNRPNSSRVIVERLPVMEDGALLVPLVLLPTVDKSWKLEGDNFRPSNMTVFKRSLKRLTRAHVEDVRKRVIDKTSTMSIERSMWPNITESAIRVVEGKPYEFDLDVLKVEADATGEEVPDLAKKIYDNAKLHLTVGRSLQGVQKKTLNAINKSEDDYDALVSIIVNLYNQTDALTKLP